VSCRTTQENSLSERLRADYKGAFDEWALQVNRLHAMTNAPSAAFEEAEARVSAAEIAYHSTRDRLTDQLMNV
jgi:hypothetical protein